MHRRAMCAAFVLAVVVTFIASSASAEDVSSVYPPVSPPQWSGPAMGDQENGYYLTTQGQQALLYRLCGGGAPTSLGGITASDLDASTGSRFIVARGQDGAVWYNPRTGPAPTDFAGGQGDGWFLAGGLTGQQPPGNQGGYAIDAFMPSGTDTVFFVTIGADGNIWDGSYSASLGAQFRRIG